MSPDIASPPEADLSPAAVRQYLAGTSQRELDALRSALDTRLATLEAALVNPGESGTLERLVIELARVATAEADSTVTRVCLQAGLEARDAVAAAESAAHAERSGAAALRASLDQAKAAFADERRTTVQLRRELDQARTAAEAMRADRESLRLALQEAQTTIEAEHAAGKLLCHTLEEARAELETERAATAGLHSALENAEQHIVILEREKAIDVHAIQERAEQGRALAQSAVARLEEQLDARERDLDAARRTAATLGDDLRAATAQLDGLEAHHAATERTRAVLDQASQDAAAPVESSAGNTSISLDELALEDEPPPAMPTIAAPPWQADQPLRASSRHAFHRAVQVLIDGGAAALVDLSTAGAQVISPTPLKPNRAVKLEMPFDTTRITCRGKIVWARLEPPSSGGPLRYRAGVYFMGVAVPAVAAFLADLPESH